MDAACPTSSRTMTIRIPQIVPSAPCADKFHVELKCARKKNKTKQTNLEHIQTPLTCDWHQEQLHCLLWCASGLEHVDSLTLLFCFPEVIGYGWMGAKKNTSQCHSLLAVLDFFLCGLYRSMYTCMPTVCYGWSFTLNHAMQLEMHRGQVWTHPSPSWWSSDLKLNSELVSQSARRKTQPSCLYFQASGFVLLNVTTPTVLAVFWVYFFFLFLTRADVKQQNYSD